MKSFDGDDGGTGDGDIVDDGGGKEGRDGGGGDDDSGEGSGEDVENDCVGAAAPKASKKGSPLRPVAANMAAAPLPPRSSKQPPPFTMKAQTTMAAQAKASPEGTLPGGPSAPRGKPASQAPPEIGEGPEGGSPSDGDAEGGGDDGEDVWRVHAEAAVGLATSIDFNDI